MNTKTLILGTAAALSAVASAATVSVDTVKQRFPWNGIVDITYTLGLGENEVLGIDDEVEFSYERTDVSPVVRHRIANFLEAPIPKTAGTHHLTWDANYEGFSEAAENCRITARIIHHPEMYMVIDVSEGPNATVYKTDFVSGQPAGGFNQNLYKGDRIVFRRIPPGSYMAGQASGVWKSAVTQHRVAITNAFYLAIFETTQKQYINVMGKNQAESYLGDYRPIDHATINGMRGTANVTSHLYDWPWNNDVDPNTILGKLRAKCRMKDGNGAYTLEVGAFDFPTEFFWEYACRAGTTTTFNDGTPISSSAKDAEVNVALGKIARFNKNLADGRGGYDYGTSIVGSYAPNAWGLYDMHGNLWEFCLDYKCANPVELKQYLNPVGPSIGDGNSTYRHVRGGSCRTANTICPSANRGQVGSSMSWDVNYSSTLRICVAAPEGR